MTCSICNHPAHQGRTCLHGIAEIEDSQIVCQCRGSVSWAEAAQLRENALMRIGNSARAQAFDEAAAWADLRVRTAPEVRKEFFQLMKSYADSQARQARSASNLDGSPFDRKLALSLKERMAYTLLRAAAADVVKFWQSGVNEGRSEAWFALLVTLTEAVVEAEVSPSDGTG
jgi:hypothetical protein